MKYFLISYALFYGGEVREISRVEFPDLAICQNVQIQLERKSEGSYAFECREIQNGEDQ